MRKNATKKSRKTDIINLRVSPEEKQKFSADAKNLGLNLSEYVLHLLRHGEIRKIEGGTELAREVHHLNCKLNDFEKYPFVPVQELRDAVSNGIRNIMDSAKQGGAFHVNHEI